MFLTTLTILISSCATPPDGGASAPPLPPPALKRLDKTAGIAITSDFTFSISPDDQWLVFFHGDDPPHLSEPDMLTSYGQLRVLNLRTGTGYAYSLRAEQAPYYPMHGVDAAWAPDGSMCVLPPPPAKDRRIIIRFAEEGPPAVSTMPEPDRWRRRGEPPPPPEEQVTLPERFTCSDCSPYENDVELIRKHLPDFVVQMKGDSPNERARLIVSPDGTRIYFQRLTPADREPDEPWDSTSLMELDTRTGAERHLITHTAREQNPRLYRLRPSPDGKYLAYQYSSGTGFVGTPRVFVLDLASGSARSIAHGDGRMHWSSTSDRLYFYRSLMGGERPHLWVAEFSRPAAPEPASATE
jgi:hypothetical protein